MSRALLQILLPLLLPTIVYVLWVFLLRGRRKPGDEEEFRWVREGPWFWLILSGVVLMGIGLGVTAWTTGEDPDGNYVAPRLEDGRVVPGRFN